MKNIFLKAVLPASEMVFIQFGEPIATIHCFNVLGECVTVELQDKQFSVSHLPKGVYFTSIVTESGSIQKRRFIRE